MNDVAAVEARHGARSRAIREFDDAAWMPTRPSFGGRLSDGMTVIGLGHAAELLV
jgi:hypothetical protein